MLRDTSAPVQQVHIAAPLALRVGGADARAGLRLSRQRLPGSSTTSPARGLRNSVKEPRISVKKHMPATGLPTATPTHIFVIIYL